MSDEDKVKEMWISKQREIIKDQFTERIDEMQKAEESDCSISDREAENFMKKRALTKQATRKISTTDLKDLKKAKIKLKKDKKQKALEEEMHSK